MSGSPLQQIAIVGAYNTPQAKQLQSNEIDVLLNAVQGALHSAGMRIAEVDGFNVTSSTQRFTSRQSVMLFGARPGWTGSDIGIPAIIEAALAINAGLCETAIIATAQVSAHRERKKTAPWTRPTNEFVECWGLFTPAEFALMARRHMHLYGTTEEQFAEIAATIRNNGARHPAACHYGKFVTPQDVLNSRMIAEPFRLLDCAMTSEGGAALILTSAARARDLDVQPVYLLGGGTDKQGMAYVTAPVWDKYGDVGRRAAKQTFSQAGLHPTDVDVLEIYDPFSFEIIRQLEVFGFCSLGEGGDFVMEGHLRMDGRFPMVTNGGLMSFSHAGLAQLIQKPISAVQQLRGEYPEELTVKDAKVALTSNGGSGALFTDVLLLGTEVPS
ncbi:MAG: thiolase family protein [Halioglobus sp.]|nr:thiolase family protein [Halioglobus sp.]